MRVEVLDPFDDVAFERWFAVHRAAFGARFPGEPHWLAVERRALLRDMVGSTWTQHLAAFDADGAMVGCAWTEMERFDNLHLAQVSLWVPPEHQGRGAGSAMVALAERLALAEGRTTLAGVDEYPVGDVRSPIERWAHHLGFLEVQATIKRELVLPADPVRLAQLEAGCRQRGRGYSILTFEDHWPEQFLGDRISLGVVMSQDQPVGDFDFHEERWDEARVRSEEALLRAMDRQYLVAAARHDESARIVAFSELGVSREDPRRAYQFDTLVLGAHRGHRLGTLVKLANLTALRDRSPATERIATHNAADNEPMIAVNDALGFKPVARGNIWQKQLR